MKNLFLKHPVKVLLLIAFLIPVAVVVFRSSLNYSGYCIPERRWLSDEEFIRSAVRRVNNYKRTTDLTKNPRKIYKHINYDSVDAFMAANPNCCRMGPLGGGDYRFPTLSEPIYGSYAAVVLVDYVQRYEGENGNRFSKREKNRLIITNCGSVR